METLTFAEAAKTTGLTKKALRNRVYRGQLQSVLRDRVRRIPRSELEREGLIPGNGEGTETPKTFQETPDVPAETDRESDVVSELLERLERQAAELGELRLLTREAESLQVDRGRLEGALHEARAKVTELEAKLAEAERPRRWWQRRQAA